MHSATIRHYFWRSMALGGVALLTSTVSRSAAAQYEVSAFRPLVIPPTGAGTCARVASPPGADGMKQVGARLVMKNRSPGRDRTLQVLIDDVRHTTMYSELLIASTEPRRSESDHVVAFFDAHGFVRGFRTHHAGELPPGPLVAL